MKRHFVKIALVSMIIFAAGSCKEKGENTDVSEAKEVAESTATASSFTINTEKSVIKWSASKPGTTHNGTVKLNSGTLSAQERDIQSGNFVIDMNSITDLDLKPGAGKENLEAHLKGTVEGKEKDFFNVTEYPTAGFEITGVEGESGNITVSGNLTIKDKTQNIEFPAVVSFPGDDVFLKSKPFTIDRTQWDINFMSKSVFDNLKDKFIDDNIELTIELHGSKG